MNWLNLALVAIQLLEGVATLISEARKIAEQEGGLSPEQWAEIDKRLKDARGRLDKALADAETTGQK